MGMSALGTEARNLAHLLPVNFSGVALLLSMVVLQLAINSSVKKSREALVRQDGFHLRILLGVGLLKAEVEHIRIFSFRLIRYSR